MKQQSELLGKLHSLSARDRAWIVERLSEQERAQLLATLAAPAPEVTAASPRPVDQPSQSDAKPTDVVKVLGRVEPRLVAAISKSEPAWLNAVIAAAQHESWTKAFLDSLPGTLRVEVERLQPWSFGAALTESATRLILERCHGDVPVESPFERLVERLSSSRAKKRMTFHL